MEELAVSRRSQRMSRFVLAIVGMAYAVLATRWYFSNIMTLIPLMSTPIGTIAFRIVWFGIELWPVTIVVTALRIGPAFTVGVIWGYLMLMYVAAFAFSGWSSGEIMGLFLSTVPNLIVQVPVWLLTFAIVSLSRPNPKPSSFAG